MLVIIEINEKVLKNISIIGIIIICADKDTDITSIM